MAITTVNDVENNLNDYLSEYKYHPDLTKKLDDIEENTPFDEFILLKIILWKINRHPDLTKFPYDELNKLSELQPENYREAESFLNVILDIFGIGLPIASTILRFRNPKTFPIIDRRAYRVIMGVNYSESQVHQKLIDKYFSYIEKCREVSEKHEIPFEQIDRVLYLFDKVENKNISLYGKNKDGNS